MRTDDTQRSIVTIFYIFSEHPFSYISIPIKQALIVDNTTIILHFNRKFKLYGNKVTKINFTYRTSRSHKFIFISNYVRLQEMYDRCLN